MRLEEEAIIEVAGWEVETLTVTKETLCFHPHKFEKSSQHIDHCLEIGKLVLARR